ncbi:MAG: hypothetical protein QW667_00145 [Candidatus Bathyarchaeia archaeon]
MSEVRIKEKVKKNYAKIAKKESCCSFLCCQKKRYERLGYSEKELEHLPEGAFSLGCGNPVALASLKEGEIVLDLGSGSGFDCFLASKKVGERGKVIGVTWCPKWLRGQETMRKRATIKMLSLGLAK